VPEGGEEAAELAARGAEGIVADLAKKSFSEAERVGVDITEDATEAAGKDAAKDIDGYASPAELARTHEIGGNRSSKNVQEIMNSMRSDGYQGDPISVYEHDGQKYVVDGHHRLAAAKRVGLKQIPFTKVGLPFRGYRTLDDVLEAVPPDNLRNKGRPF
jgi:hypothetical protein